MARIKSYTDINQSKKIAEILPIESADMFIIFAGDREIIRINDNIKDYNSWDTTPVWSLAALLGILPKIHGLKPVLDLEENSIQYSGIDLYIVADNPVDACVAMIEKLHELKML